LLRGSGCGLLGVGGSWVTDGEPAPTMIPGNDLVAVELWLAVRGGDLGTTGRLLAGKPGLARARLAAPDGGQDAAARDGPILPQQPAAVNLLS